MWKKVGSFLTNIQRGKLTRVVYFNLAPRYKFPHEEIFRETGGGILPTHEGFIGIAYLLKMSAVKDLGATEEELGSNGRL